MESRNTPSPTDDIEGSDGSRSNSPITISHEIELQPPSKKRKAITKAENSKESKKEQEKNYTILELQREVILNSCKFIYENCETWQDLMDVNKAYLSGEMPMCILDFYEKRRPPKEPINAWCIGISNAGFFILDCIHMIPSKCLIASKRYHSYITGFVEKSQTNFLVEHLTLGKSIYVEVNGFEIYARGELLQYNECFVVNVLANKVLQPWNVCTGIKPARSYVELFDNICSPELCQYMRENFDHLMIVDSEYYMDTMLELHSALNAADDYLSKRSIFTVQHLLKGHSA